MGIPASHDYNQARVEITHHLNVMAEAQSSNDHEDIARQLRTISGIALAVASRADNRAAEEWA